MAKALLLGQQITHGIGSGAHNATLRLLLDAIFDTQIASTGLIDILSQSPL